jgi:hypothetical protein
VEGAKMAMLMMELKLNHCVVVLLNSPTYTEENFEPFWLIFDRLVATIAGKKIWTNHDKVGVPITTGVKITIVDEAFTILAIQNYWPKWFSTMGVPSPAKWTDLRQGNSQYMGWHEEAYSWFDQICHHINQQRANVHSKHLKLTFQQHATSCTWL